jgi:hypothetical protein
MVTCAPRLVRLAATAAPKIPAPTTTVRKDVSYRDDSAGAASADEESVPNVIEDAICYVNTAL